MYKSVILGLMAVFLICESSCQRIIRPTFRPPRRPVLIRLRRDNGPYWLYKGDDNPKAPAARDHTYLPKYIDEFGLNDNSRLARSLSTPKGIKGGHRSSHRKMPYLPKWPTLPDINPTLTGPRSPWKLKPVHIPVLGSRIS